MKWTLAFGGIVLLVSGCTIAGRDYTESEVTVPARYVGGPSSVLPDAAATHWWSALSDRTLNSLVEIGLAENIDIRAAMARMQAAQAAARGAGVPEQISGSVTADALRRRDRDGIIETEESVGANAAFVLDLFGGVRRSREQAVARLGAAQFDVGTVRLAYITDLVGSYAEARYFQTAAAITRQSISSRRRTLALIQNRFNAEEATSLELARARSLLATAEASLPSFEAGFYANAYRVAALVNRRPDSVVRRLQQGGGQPRPRGNLSVGAPADLIRNRPDIRRAERDFAATIAAIGVSEAQLYPSLSILGSIRSGTDRTWSFGPSITIPLLDLPLRISNRNIAIANAREAEQIYRATIRDGIIEAQTALTRTLFVRREVGAYSRAASAAREVLTLSRTSYDVGEVTLIDLLDAEREALNNQLELARAIRDLTTNWARLQAALGKGWLAGVEEVRVTTGG